MADQSMGGQEFILFSMLFVRNVGWIPVMDVRDDGSMMALSMHIVSVASL